MSTVWKSFSLSMGTTNGRFWYLSYKGGNGCGRRAAGMNAAWNFQILDSSAKEQAIKGKR